MHHEFQTHDGIRYCISGGENTWNELCRDLVCPNICSSTSQGLVDLRGEFVFHHTREDHEILGHTEQLFREPLVHIGVIAP